MHMGSVVSVTVYLIRKAIPVTLPHLFQSPDQVPSNISINNATHPKSRYDPPHPCHSTHAPVPRHSGEPLREPESTLSIEQIESEQVDRRAEQLHRSRRQELCRIGPASFGVEDPAELVFK